MSAILTGQNGMYTRDATAVASDILAGKTAYVNDAKITGTMPSLGAQTITPGTTNQIIASAQYLSGAQTILGDANLLAGYIKTGIPIFGVTGTYTKTVVFVSEQIQSTVRLPACGNTFGLGVTFSSPIRSLISARAQLFTSDVINILTGPIISGNTISWTFENTFFNSGADVDYIVQCYVYTVA